MAAGGSQRGRVRLDGCFMAVDPIVRLRRIGEKLPRTLRAEILALGSGAVGQLVDVLREDEGDWASIHAVDLLVDLKANEAIEPLLLALRESTFDDILFSRIVVRLPELGAPVLEPALAFLADNEDDADASHGLCEVLASLGIKDDRIFDALRNVFDQGEVQFGAGMLAAYGDSKALPLVVDAIASFTPDFKETWSRGDLVELLAAHERLGGVLPPELRERVDRWIAAWKATSPRSVSSNGAGGQRKVGRNEPCPCGSGKKYKKCCLGSDEAARPRVVEADGHGFHMSGGVSDEHLTMAAEFFREKDAGRGPARQMADYAQPILDATEQSLDSVQAALNIAMLFWNLAVTRDDAERERALSDMALQINEAERAEFERTARMMIDRHRAMFPEMHRAK